jgi:hypothetical protein
MLDALPDATLPISSLGTGFNNSRGWRFSFSNLEPHKEYSILSEIVVEQILFLPTNTMTYLL